MTPNRIVSTGTETPEIIPNVKIGTQSNQSNGLMNGSVSNEFLCRMIVITARTILTSPTIVAPILREMVILPILSSLRLPFVADI